MTEQGDCESHTCISIEGVGKKYGDHQVFPDISLSFKEREIVTVVGPSGWGKITLLRCVDSPMPVSEGAMRIDGDLAT